MVADITTDKLLISGPINVVRITGQIEGVNKILHIYFDNHISVSQQTQCAELRSKNIKDYLIENFDRISKIDKTVDFFLEILPATVRLEPDIVHTKYIWELQELFKLSFNYDVKKNKVLKSTEFPNVRFHYIDIREYMKSDVSNILDNINRKINYIIDRRYISRDDVNMLKNAVKMLISRLKSFYNILYGEQAYKLTRAKHIPTIPKDFDDLSKYTSKEMIDKIRSLLDKIKHNYIHDDVKKNIVNVLDINIKSDFDALFVKINTLYKSLDNLKDKIPEENTLYIPSKDDPRLFSARFGYYTRDNGQFLSTIANIAEQIEDIGTINMDIFVKLVDLYFLRRFLDKDYITNAMIYVGSHHAVHYISLLVKYFNFKITHTSYIADNLNKVHQMLKEEPFDYMSPLFYPKILYQCSDITNFPQLFE